MFGLFKDNSEKHASPIVFYNSATGEKEKFVPRARKVITMYACGPTVYDHIHIGNMRAYLLPDLLHRLFLYNGYTVKFTINFTDFGHLSDDGDDGEDKMMKGMRREGYPISLEAMREFAEPYINSFKEDNTRFGNLPPTQYARASDYIKEQIKLIETLCEKGYAYETDDGVYFDIRKFPRYGVLGNVDVTKLRAGARVAVNQQKRHPADFALWKKGALGWKSKWGLGFPGWHIECTAMVFATLGKHIDIHTGGEDLMYTHHNGEIAQAESATGKAYVNYWLHNAHITIHEQKIAKSAGNGMRLQELIAKGFDPLDYRYWLLQSHYRTTTNFTYDGLKSAQQARTRLKRYVYGTLREIKQTHIHEKYESRFVSAIHDDLNTPEALAILWELVRDESVPSGAKLATIRACDSLIHIGLSKDMAAGATTIGHLSASEIPEEVALLIQKRDMARTVKNWQKADELRALIETKGFVLEDSQDGTVVTKK